MVEDIPSSVLSPPPSTPPRRPGGGERPRPPKLWAAAPTPRADGARSLCGVCGRLTSGVCSGCKFVPICSVNCLRSLWDTEHRTFCPIMSGGARVGPFATAGPRAATVGDLRAHLRDRPWLGKE
jgi:hypothetical protein